MSVLLVFSSFLTCLKQALEGAQENRLLKPSHITDALKVPNFSYPLLKYSCMPELNKEVYIVMFLFYQTLGFDSYVAEVEIENEATAAKIKVPHETLPRIHHTIIQLEE